MGEYAQIWLEVKQDTKNILPSFVVGEVPIRVGSPEAGSHKGLLRTFPTNGEHKSMGTSTYVKISKGRIAIIH
jgi:hypothetical protein